jgi:hypothetical protein
VPDADVRNGSEVFKRGREVSITISLPTHDGALMILAEKPDSPAHSHKHFARLHFHHALLCNGLIAF